MRIGKILNKYVGRIGQGAHAQLHSDQGCLMEWKYRLCTCTACTERKAANPEELTDDPPCTNTLITKTAQLLNDTLGEEHRQGLEVFLARIDRCRKTSRDVQIAQRLAAWAAEDAQVSVASIASVPNPSAVASIASTPNRRAARVRTALEAADRAVRYANVDPELDNHARVAIASAMEAATATALVDGTWGDDSAAGIAFFDRLLDAWEKAAVEEGVLTEIDPTDYCDFTAVGGS